MLDPIKEIIANLPTLPDVQETEIRIFIEGGTIHDIIKGKKIPDTVIVNIVDYDIDGMEPDEIKERCFLDAEKCPCIFQEI